MASLQDKISSKKTQIRALSGAIIALEIAALAAIATPFAIGLSLELTIATASLLLEKAKGELTNEVYVLTESYIDKNRRLLQAQHNLNDIVMDTETCLRHINRLGERHRDFEQLLSRDELDLWADLEAHLEVTMDNVALAKEALIAGLDSNGLDVVNKYHVFNLGTINEEIQFLLENQ